MKKIYNFELMRIIFICAIIVHHFYNGLTGIWTFGGAAVDFFYIISGLVFALSFNPHKSLYHFLYGKLIRFWPLLVLVAVITGIALEGCDLNVYRLLADVFLLAHTGLYKASGGFGYNTPGWFVCVLFWVSLLFFYVKKNINKNSANLILGLLTFFAFLIPMIYDVPPYCRLFKGLATFGLGYFCGEICLSCERNENNKKQFFISVVELCLLVHFVSLLFIGGRNTNPVANDLLMALFLFLLYKKDGYVSSFLDKGIFSHFSKYVLSIYLSHVILYAVLLRNLLKVMEISESYNVAICILGVATSWLFGILLYHLIEKPCQRYLSKK